jgi:2-C-methyl-D-erythritol 2,4-cyclodiphosphate synthase
MKLGGVEIPFGLGLLGHSDGDVVLHALADALLGAAGLGDIGMLFPDTEYRWKGADSRDLLAIVREQVGKQGWEVVNADIVVHAEQPKLGPYKGQMKRVIAGLLEVDFADVNVKAKTNEGLDAVGQALAIAATAVVLLRRELKKTL